MKIQDDLSYRTPPNDCFYNLGQEDADKFTKLSKIGFFMEFFTAKFLRFFTEKNIKIWLLGGRLDTRHRIQAFQGFS